MIAQLSSKQRLERCLRGQSVDRVPLWMLYNAINQQNPWYPNPFEVPSYRRLIQKVLVETDILQRHWFSPGVFYSTPEIIHKSTQVWRDEGYRMYETRLQTPSGEMISYNRKNAAGQVEHKALISDIEDLDRILSIEYHPFRPGLEEFRRIKQELGDRGLMMMNLCDPVSLLYFHCDPEPFLLWTISEMDKLTGFLDIIFERLMEHLQYLLDEGIGPVFFIVGSEFACPPVVSPQFFRRLIFQYDKQMIDRIHAYDGLVIMHHHGRAQKVLDDILRMGPDGIHPLESPPVGDTPLEMAKAMLGKRVTLIGNLQYDTLIRGSMEQLEGELVQIIQAWKPGGRFILAPTAGPYQSELSDLAINNYLRMIQIGAELGRFD
jgi:uroporphyrinogen-III decarboxylase